MSTHSTTRTCSRSRAAARGGRGPAELQRVMVGLLVAIALGVAILAVCVRAPMPAPAEWSVVSVDANGSLWQIASSHPVTGLSTAETVELIQRENSLDSATIYAGQSLRVPQPATAGGTSFAQR